MYVFSLFLLLCNTMLFSCLDNLKYSLGFPDGTPEQIASYYIQQGDFKNLENLVKGYPMLRSKNSLAEEAKTRIEFFEKEHNKIHGKYFCGRTFLFTALYGLGIYINFTSFLAETPEEYIIEIGGRSAPLLLALHQFYKAIRRTDTHEKYLNALAISALFNKSTSVDQL